MPELVLALDVGTTSARAIVLAPGGPVLGAAARPIATRFPAPGRAEQDAAEVWRLAQAVMHEALTQAGRRAADLAAIGLTTQRASAVVWRREDGEPAAPMVLWSDLSGAARAREFAAAGFPGAVQAPACKLEALLARCGQGDLLWGGLDSYLAYRLSGGAAHVTDLSSAWMTGMLDYRGTLGWNREMLGFMGVAEERFPSIVETCGVFARTPAALLGAEVPVAALVADQQGALFAHGGLAAGRWKASLGTSAAVIASTGEAPVGLHPTMPPEALACLGGRPVFGVEGMVVSAGSAVEWMCSGLRMFDSPAQLAAAAATADAAGVHMRPSLQGLGAPHGDYGARGVFTGLHPGVGPENLARALLEGLCFRLREIADVIAGAIPVEPALSVDGGLTRSDALLQLLADACGRPVQRLEAREGTAVGAAMAAALGVGLVAETDLPGLARYDRIFEPAIGRDAADTAYAAWAQAVGLAAD